MKYLLPFTTVVRGSTVTEGSIPLIGLISEENSLQHHGVENTTPTQTLSWGPLQLLTVSEKNNLCEKVLQQGANALNLCMETAGQVINNHTPLKGMAVGEIKQVCERLNSYLNEVSTLAKSNEKTAQKVCQGISEEDVKIHEDVHLASCAAVQRLLSKGVHLDSVCQRLSLPNACLTELKQARNLRGHRACDLGLADGGIVPVTPVQRFMNVCQSTLHSLHATRLIHPLNEAQKSSNLLFFNAADDTVMTNCAKALSSTVHVMDYSLSTCWDMAATYLETSRPAGDFIPKFCEDYASWLVEEKKMGDGPAHHVLSTPVARPQLLAADATQQLKGTGLKQEDKQPRAGVIARIVADKPEQQPEQHPELSNQIPVLVPMAQSTPQQQIQPQVQQQIQPQVQQQIQPQVQVVPVTQAAVQPQAQGVIRVASQAAQPVYSQPVVMQPSTQAVVPMVQQVPQQAVTQQVIPVRHIPMVQQVAKEITPPIAPPQTLHVVAKDVVQPVLTPSAPPTQTIQVVQNGKVFEVPVQHIAPQAVQAVAASPQPVQTIATSPTLPTHVINAAVHDHDQVSSPEEVDVKSDKVDLKVVEEKVNAAKKTADMMIKKEQEAKKTSRNNDNKSRNFKKRC